MLKTQICKDMNDSIINVIANSEGAGKLAEAASAYIYAQIIFGAVVLIISVVFIVKFFSDWH